MLDLEARVATLDGPKQELGGQSRIQYDYVIIATVRSKDPRLVAPCADARVIAGVNLQRSDAPAGWRQDDRPSENLHAGPSKSSCSRPEDPHHRCELASSSPCGDSPWLMLMSSRYFQNPQMRLSSL